MKKINNHNELPTLKVLGVDSSRTKALKQNLHEALEQLHLEVILEEVRDVEQLMKYDISGIPALVMNEEVILQKEVPTVETLKEILISFFSRHNSLYKPEDL